MDKVIFIDRDGVINVDLMGDYIKNRGEFRFEAGAVEALKKFIDEGFKIIIISNQAGVGDGVFTEEDLEDVHSFMLDELKKSNVEIFASHYCLHGKNADCECRKPKTVLFDQAMENLSIDKTETYFIGDKATDIEAGKRYGLKTCFVRTGHGVNDESKLINGLEPDIRADNLLEATKVLLG